MMHVTENTASTAQLDSGAGGDALHSDKALTVHVLAAGSNGGLEAVATGRAAEIDGLMALIKRLENVVEEETNALTSGARIDFDDFSARKSRSILEFVRRMRAQPHLSVEVEVIEEIQQLRQKLERNQRVLEMHYSAVRDVAEVIVRAIRETESDGTYTAGTAQAGK